MLMQFLLVRENGPEKFLEWEHDFEHVESWLESLQPPKWKWKFGGGPEILSVAIFTSLRSTRKKFISQLLIVLAMAYPERFYPSSLEAI